MKRPIVSKDSLDLQSNHFLRRRSGYPIGASLGELDYLRGWKDDFLGDSLHEQYTLAIVGGGSLIDLQNFRGGVVRVRAGGAAGRFSLLELGDAAGGYEPLDADNGWLQIGYLQLSHTTDIYAGLYAYNVGGTEIVFTGIRTDVVAANWIIRAHDGVAFAHTDTGVAADTDWHWHVQEVYPITAGHQIDYWLDGSLIGSQTTRIPTIQLAPGLLAYAFGETARALYADYWAVIPRNL